MAKERKINGKARFEILLEDLHGKIDTILEGREITDNKIDRLEQKVDANKVELELTIMKNSQSFHDKIDDVRTELSQRMDKIEQKVDAVDRKIYGVKTELKQDINKLDKKIDKIDKKLTIR